MQRTSFSAARSQHTESREKQIFTAEQASDGLQSFAPLVARLSYKIN
jgi:hypothetical protein